MNNKLHNLSILPIDAHNLGYVTNYLTCTIASDSKAIQGMNSQNKLPSLALHE